MYGKKIDSTDDKHHNKKKEPPPAHEFAYRWFRGPLHDPCAYEQCPRRTSFSPHEWSKHALGGVDCALQCVSNQSSLYRCTFCNAECLVKAWKTQQYTVRDRSATPQRSRSGSVASNDSFDSNEGTKSPGSYANSTNSNINGEIFSPGTPRNPYTDDFSDEWIEISQEQLYMPGPEDVGRKLKIEAAAYAIESGQLLMSRVAKTDVVLGRAPNPLPRAFVHTKAAAGGGPRFRVATYNVLAEIYATQQQYPYCDFWALSWDYRFQNIFREIMEAAPDVICLQEVQADHYENHVYDAFSEAGFDSVFKQKTRQSMGLAGKVDGCALLWRRSKFHLVESYSIEFNELAQRQATQILGYNARSEEGAAFINRLSKDNIAQLIVLEFIQPGRSSRDVNQLCIANTHLYSNKDFPDVKLWQAWQLMQELESFILSRTTNLPLIICGDFNSQPETAVYDLLSRQQVHPGHPDVNMANKDDVPNVLPDAMNISHSFQLGSAYNSILGDEPWTTNYTAQFKGTLDYVWYSANNLRPISVATIPEEAELTKHGEALPSTEYGSDHIMLISDMQIINGR